MKRMAFWSACLLFVTAACGLVSIGGCAPSSDTTQAALPTDTVITRSNDRVEVISPVHHIDKIYPSMTGPWSETRLPLLDSTEPELVWITGAEVRMLNPTGTQRMPDEFMCHVNLDLNSNVHCRQMGLTKPLDGRLFTLSQGQLEVKFPEGTGIPVRSDLPLSLICQALNLNVQDANFDVRHHVTLHFVRDRDAKQPMTPLYESGLSSHVSLEEKPLAYDVMDYGTGSRVLGMCIPGEKAVDWAEQHDRYGRRFTAHWIVPPGRQENHTRCTSIMNVPQDTRIHAIGVHLHPYAESLELRDITENKTLFKSTARNFANRIGLEHIESFSSAEGIPVYNNHEYELVAVYNNTSEKDVDSMAVLYLYMADPEFDRQAVLRRLTAEPAMANAATDGKQETTTGENAAGQPPRM